ASGGASAHYGIFRSDSQRSQGAKGWQSAHRIPDHAGCWTKRQEAWSGFRPIIGSGSTSVAAAVAPTEDVSVVEGAVVDLASTTLADLLMPPLAAYPFSAVWTSLWRWSSQERENGVTYGGQSWLGRWAAGSFFSALRLRGGDTGGRRRRSSS